MESLVADYFQQQNFQILERNFHCRLGEIDLIIRQNTQNQCLIFVEVRFRKNNLYGGPLASIDRKKQQKLIRSAEFYLKIRPYFKQYTCRFDVVGITIDNGLPKLEWIQNAFQAY
jgi:putative endonuclease